ncbi:MAG TPA: MerR family transcriptional regulator [Treponemataceae bacterium]|nr:MerR family transcriptional regulator [Treponemataceae bacterium]
MEKSWFTIKQAGEKTGLTEHTIRYYDKEGLLPQLKRTQTGIRKFSENDIEWLGLICCLKNSGMPIEKIKRFMHLCLSGSKTNEERKILLQEHREYILHQKEVLEKSLSTVNYKIDHYKEIGIFHLCTED